MQNEPNFETFRQAFSSRTEIASALAGALEPTTDDYERLQTARSALDAVLSGVGKGEIEDSYRAFLVALEIFLVLVEWKRAIRNAEQDSQRYLNSAKLRAAELSDADELVADRRLSEFLEQVEKTSSLGDLGGLRGHLERWFLPLLLFASQPPQDFSRVRRRVADDGALPGGSMDATVAFLRFDIDGEPARQYNYLSPGVAYDLSVEIRVSNWPNGAETLSVVPVTIDARERQWLPKFEFQKPEGDGPHMLSATGRAVLEIAHSFGSRPYEFLYAAEFDDSSDSREVAIVGHRRLLLEGTDVASNPLTGFSNLDRHLLSIRDELRLIVGLFPENIANALTVLAGVGNVAAQALKGGIFAAGTSEAEFQRKTVEILRSRSDIGEHLQEHVKSAGGYTDLTFHNIPIELKVENKKVVFTKDVSVYFDQTSAYAIGLGSRIAILSVLEASSKSKPLGVVEDDIEVFSHSAGQSTVQIVVVIVRGGFPAPSSYSR